MTPIEQKALALVNEIAKDRGTSYPLADRKNDSRWEALCRTIEREQAFRQEVSDAVEDATVDWSDDPCEGAIAVHNLRRFIIAKPVDPLVEAMSTATANTRVSPGETETEARCRVFRAALKARVLKIVETTDE